MNDVAEDSEDSSSIRTEITQTLSLFGGTVLVVLVGLALGSAF